MIFVFSGFSIVKIGKPEVRMRGTATATTTRTRGAVALAMTAAKGRQNILVRKF